MEDNSDYVRPAGPADRTLCIFIMLLHLLSCAVVAVYCLLKIDIISSVIFNDSFYQSSVFTLFRLHTSATVGSAILAELIITAVFILTYKVRRFPSSMTIIGLSYNVIAETVFMFFFRYLEINHLVFAYQSLFVIPLITMVLASVFAVDDVYDYLSGHFEPTDFRFRKISEKKPIKKNDVAGRPDEKKTQLSSLPTPDLTDSALKPADPVRIEGAAKLVIPSLYTEEDKVPDTGSPDENAGNDVSHNSDTNTENKNEEEKKDQ